MYTIGIDLGGTNIAVGICNEDLEIIDKASAPTLSKRPIEQIVADMAALCKKLAERNSISMDKIDRIGIAVPGTINSARGIVEYSNNIVMKNTPIVELFKKHIDKEVLITNDANAAALGEALAGSGKGKKSLVMVTLGTGVGGGIVIGGRPYSGAHGCGSEIGHMILKMDGEMCTCGNAGCFERYASATAIIREAKKAVADHPESSIMEKCGGDVEKINAKIVIDSAKEGDETAKMVFDGYVRGLAHGIVSIINMIDPEVILLGGGVAHAGQFLLDAVREAVKPLVFFKTMPYARIELAQLGNDAGIIGAAFLGKK